MGDIGIDKWIGKMNEHTLKGHHIIVYDERTMEEIEQEFLLKEQRVKFWEQNRRIPTLNELSLDRSEAEA